MTILTTELAANVWVGDGLSSEALCEVQWDRRDPMALKFAFVQGGEDPVVWVAGRDLVIEGLKSEHFVGAGDFACCAKRGELRLHLKSPEGEAIVWMPRQQVDSLIEGSQRVVPPGSRHEERIAARAFDKQLAAFMDGSAS